MGTSSAKPLAVVIFPFNLKQKKPGAEAPGFF
jgi:hypothetical protein